MVFERPDRDGGASDPSRARTDEAGLDTPNCGVCLHPMEVAVTAGSAPFWACTSCDSSRIA